MEFRVKVKTVNKHFCDHSFVMIAERQDRGQYLVCVDNYGTPWRIVKAEDMIAISYKYRGYGEYTLEACAQSIGRDDPTLDPICEALIKKGWSRSLLKMYFLEYEPLWNAMADWALKPIKSKWDGDREKYLITEASTSVTRSTYGPDWAIQVHLEDSGFLRVCVGVPEIYEADQLGKLLMAIKSLPDADEMIRIHPAMLAKAS